MGTQAACSCLENYIGRSPNCRPECTINAECPGNLACLNERCRDPCPGSCGSFTTCSVVKHAPICQCLPEYTGDPFNGCSPIPLSKNTFLLIEMRSYLQNVATDLALSYTGRLELWLEHHKSMKPRNSRSCRQIRIERIFLKK